MGAYMGGAMPGFGGYMARGMPGMGAYIVDAMPGFGGGMPAMGTYMSGGLWRFNGWRHTSFHERRHWCFQGWWHSFNGGQYEWCFHGWWHFSNTSYVGDDASGEETPQEDGTNGDIGGNEGTRGNGGATVIKMMSGFAMVPVCLWNYVALLLVYVCLPNFAYVCVYGEPCNAC
jgi:hypothetical protein